MELKKHGIITPKPYYELSFCCSNRSFYNVKNEIYDLANEHDVEIGDTIYDKCDYEGDLEKMIIYDKSFAEKVLALYGVTNVNIGDMHLELTCN
ncbi:MAG TPA: hypothetical protein VFM18_15585 [Methanosarcina sp.]|nr:hypothetical protein [Methanosarcina sp.]